MEQFLAEVEASANKNLVDPMQKVIDEQAARIAELEAAANPDKHQGCQFGVLGAGSVSGNYPDLYPAIEIVRCYTGTINNWANEPQHKKVTGVGLYAPSNTIGLSLTDLDALLGSIPEDEKAKITGWCDTHEPENPAKKLNPTEYRARRSQSNRIIRDHGLLAVSCLMGWTADPQSGRNWKDWVDLDSTDVLCWDTYNAGNKKNPPVYQDVNKMLADMVRTSEEVDLPWGLWETGTSNFGSDANRITWIKQLRQACIDKNAVEAIYFDRKGVSNPDWDASLNHDTASAWLNV